tara:strand:- start:293 stop:841 length:549 start_codon:yes stop_codon:yes gene_type:complete
VYNQYDGNADGEWMDDAEAEGEMGITTTYSDVLNISWAELVANAISDGYDFLTAETETEWGSKFGLFDRKLESETIGGVIMTQEALVYHVCKYNELDCDLSTWDDASLETCRPECIDGYEDLQGDLEMGYNSFVNYGEDEYENAASYECSYCLYDGLPTPIATSLGVFSDGGKLWPSINYSY